MEPKQPAATPHGRQKMSYACEACRAAKTKCQSGPEPDICKRCSEFKRECIFRTGPRTRRPKAALRANSEAAALPPPPGPSKTFSIDFEMPVEADPGDSFEMLREKHERFLDDLVLNSGDDEDEQQQQQAGGDLMDLVRGHVPEQHKTFSFNDMSSSSPSAAPSGTSSSRAASSAGGGGPAAQKSKPMLDLGIKPQFNLDSATKLLAAFRGMLPHLPFFVLPETESVRSLAKNSPFILLAILAVTSCSNSLQGHSLYDEEFRKVLGLKFVAGGERSLELLRGVLIYCSWYPFHVRPKNRQAFQYLRMAVDIVHDLEMEQEPAPDLFFTSPEERARTMDSIRGLLGCYYSMSTFTVTWGKPPSSLRYSPQLARCADALEQHSELAQDHHLVWLVRLQHTFEELVAVQRDFERGPRDHQSEMQRNLVRVGLEAQFRDFRARMPESYASETSIFLASQLAEAFVIAAPLFRIPRRLGAKDVTETVSAERLLRAAHKARAIFDHIVSLPPRALSGLTGADFGRFIVTVIISYRLSFPMLAICRDYDVAHGRRILALGETLRRLTEGDDAREDPGGKAGGGAAAGTAAKKPRTSDAVSALKVVLRSVKRKFEEKSAALEAMPAAAAGEEWAGRDFRSLCPMLNGSLEQYIPLWAGQQSAGSQAMSQTGSSGVVTDNTVSSAFGIDPGTPFSGPAGQLGLGTGPFEDKTLMYHDLWATMTTGWAGDMGEVNIEDIGNTGYGETWDQT
ncbi:hypothetical protein F4802DRAFT_597077 [Xylaria palmicola]|nr:hypothetical protein F4802DRAFT_597077 [Xylaria palmicola]